MYKQREWDKRYKKGTDTGAMSHHSVPLPLKPMSTLQDKKYHKDEPKQEERLKWARKHNRKNPKCQEVNRCKPKPKK